MHVVSFRFRVLRMFGTWCRVSLVGKGQASVLIGSGV